jgi:saccharopine dehydrogenase (NAD+, L-lysine-forming)
MQGSILIVGGYGHVGHMIASYLANNSSDHIIVAGRSLAKAQALAHQHQAQISARQLDLADPSHYAEALEDVGLVIVCLEQQNQDFASECFKRGIDYIDISASQTILEAIEALDPLAQQHNTTAVLSVGLSPGLTNLLAAYLVQMLDQTERLEITVLLNLGETHGIDSLRWMVEQTNATFQWQGAHTSHLVSGFSEGRLVELPTPFGQRKAYRFDFADQHLLRKSLDVPEVSTRVCFDSAFATELLAVAKQLGLTSYVAKLDPSQLAKLMEKVPLGGNQSLIQVEAFGSRHQHSLQLKLSALAKGTAESTALVTALTALELRSRSYPAGVYQIEKIFQPLRLIRALIKHGIVFDLGLAS